MKVKITNTVKELDLLAGKEYELKDKLAQDLIDNEQAVEVAVVVEKKTTPKKKNTESNKDD